MDNRTMIRCARAYREMLLKDPYRPRYHFCVPDDNGVPGDPNGCFFADGRHHLMYLYQRDESDFCWGHVSSNDLIHFRHHPDALSKRAPDGGCFSGGAFVDSDGRAWLSYWVFSEGGYGRAQDEGLAGIGLAYGDPPYDDWTRLDGVALPSTRWGIRMTENGPIGIADPSNIWKANGVYNMLTGNLLVLDQYGRRADSPLEMRGDWAELFTANDLRGEWRYQGRFYERARDNRWTDETEDNMCPSFLPLPLSREGGIMSDKQLLLFIAHNRGAQYYIGSQRGARFEIEKHGRMSWTDNTFLAPEAYIDGMGRQIMFAWLIDNPVDDFKRFGWSGVMCLPRVLWLGGDGELRMAAADELRALRMREQSFTDTALTGVSDALPIVNGLSCELRARIDTKSRAGFILRESADGKVCARAYYDYEKQELCLDTRESGADGRPALERAPLKLNRGEPLDLAIYIDQSVIEVFANDKQAICRRVYTAKENAGIRLFADGETRFERVEAWEMSPSLPY